MRALSSEDCCMQLGMIGLGRMGANMARRLMQHGHGCVVYDAVPAAIAALAAEGATPAASLEEFVAKLTPPRAIWLMIPAALVEQLLQKLAPLLTSNDIVIDGGNSDYRDAIRRHHELHERELHFID